MNIQTQLRSYDKTLIKELRILVTDIRINKHVIFNCRRGEEIVINPNGLSTINNFISKMNVLQTSFVPPTFEELENYTNRIHKFLIEMKCRNRTEQYLLMYNKYVKRINAIKDLMDAIAVADMLEEA